MKYKRNENDLNGISLTPEKDYLMEARPYGDLDEMNIVSENSAVKRLLQRIDRRKFGSVKALVLFSENEDDGPKCIKLFKSTINDQKMRVKFVRKGKKRVRYILSKYGHIIGFDSFIRSPKSIGNSYNILKKKNVDYFVLCAKPTEAYFDKLDEVFGRHQWRPFFIYKDLPEIMKISFLNHIFNYLLRLIGGLD